MSFLDFISERMEEKMISYNKLWKLLIDKNLNKKELIKLSGVSSSSIAKMTKGQNVTTDVLCKICKALDCDFCDIMEFIRDENQHKKPTR